MGLFRRRPRHEPIASATDAVTSEPAGPSWMAAAVWADRLVAYRRQGRSEADIREVARHLERRGPYKPRDQVARAKSPGLVARVEYLAPEDEARALHPDGTDSRTPG